MRRSFRVELKSRGQMKDIKLCPKSMCQHQAGGVCIQCVAKIKVAISKVALKFKNKKIDVRLVICDKDAKILKSQFKKVLQNIVAIFSNVAILGK